MPGLVPDPVAGTVPITDALGNELGDVPQAGLFSSFGTSFTVAGGLSYLRPAGIFGSCGGRVTPMQMNFVVSELLALAAAVSPNFAFDPGQGTNLAQAFAVVMDALLTVPNLTALLNGLPTTQPDTAGVLWNNGGQIQLSQAF